MTVRERLRRVSRVFIKTPDGDSLISAGSLSELDLGDASSFRDLEPLNQLPEVVTKPAKHGGAARRKASRMANKQRWSSEELKHYLEELKNKEIKEPPRDKDLSGVVPDLISLVNQDAKRALEAPECSHSPDTAGPNSATPKPLFFPGEVRTMSLDTHGFKVNNLMLGPGHGDKPPGNPSGVAIADKEEGEATIVVPQPSAEAIATIDTAEKNTNQALVTSKTPSGQDPGLDPCATGDEEQGTTSNLPSFLIEQSKEDALDPPRPDTVSGTSLDEAVTSYSLWSSTLGAREEKFPVHIGDMPIRANEGPGETALVQSAGISHDNCAAPHIKHPAVSGHDYDDYLVAQYVDWKGAIQIKKNEKGDALGYAAESLPVSPTCGQQESALQPGASVSPHQTPGRRPLSISSLADSTGLISNAEAEPGVAAASQSPLATAPAKRSPSRKSPASAISPKETIFPTAAVPDRTLPEIRGKHSGPPVLEGTRDAAPVATGAPSKLTRVGSCKRASKRIARRLIVRMSRVLPPSV